MSNLIEVPAGTTVSDVEKSSFLERFDDAKHKFGLTNYEIAGYVSCLGEDDFFEVLLHIGYQHGCKTDEEAISWLNSVLLEIKDIREKREAGET